MVKYEKRLVYLNLVLAIVVVSILVMFSFTSILRDVRMPITGMAVADETSKKILAGFIRPCGLDKDSFSCSDEKDPGYLDTFKKYGMNTIISSAGEYKWNRYNYSGEDYGLPQRFVKYAQLADDKNMGFFTSLAFNLNTSLHSHDDAFDYTAYYCDYAGCKPGEHVSAWDEKYWETVTRIAVNLAKLDNKEGYKVDGIFLDFELYFASRDGATASITETWGFEDHIFEKSINNGTCSGVENPPVDTEDRAQRWIWLNSNKDCLKEHFLFLGNELKRLATNLKEKVKSENPEFLIGFYPSPKTSKYHAYRNRYYDNICSGLGNLDDPIVLFATESVSLGKKSSIFNLLEDRKLPGKDYYNLTNINADYTDEIYAYYVSGIYHWNFNSSEWADTLLGVSNNTNGYWFWTADGFVKDYDLVWNTSWDIQCPCDKTISECLYHQKTLGACESREAYEQEVLLYLEQMNIVKSELKAVPFRSNSFCSNDLCEGSEGETCSSCQDDCGECEEEITCGDGSCNGDEDCLTCEQDCGECEEESCEEVGYYCVEECGAGNGRSYSCESGVCCSKLPNETDIIIIEDKTCSEMNGLECGDGLSCNGSLVGTKDSSRCCLGECVEPAVQDEPEEDSNYWLYGIVGGIVALILGVVGYILYEVNSKKW